MIVERKSILSDKELDQLAVDVGSNHIKNGQTVAGLLNLLGELGYPVPQSIDFDDFRETRWDKSGWKRSEVLGDKRVSLKLLGTTVPTGGMGEKLEVMEAKRDDWNGDGLRFVMRTKEKYASNV